MQTLLNKLTRVTAQVVPTTRLGVCPSTQQEHVKASSESLFCLVDPDGNETLALWLCANCQGLFYTQAVVIDVKRS